MLYACIIIKTCAAMDIKNYIGITIANFILIYVLVYQYILPIPNTFTDSWHFRKVWTNISFYVISISQLKSLATNIMQGVQYQHQNISFIMTIILHFNGTLEYCNTV